MNQRVKSFVWPAIEVLGALAIMQMLWFWLPHWRYYQLSHGFEIDTVTIFVFNNYQSLPLLAVGFYGVLFYAKRKGKWAIYVKTYRAVCLLILLVGLPLWLLNSIFGIPYTNNSSSMRP